MSSLTAVDGTQSSSSGTFSLSSIKILEDQKGYTRWRRDIDDWLILNNLDPADGEVLQTKACTCIKNRLGINARALVADNKDPTSIKVKIEEHYKPSGSGTYTELLKKLYSISLSTESSIDEYTRQFREVDTELKALDPEAAIKEPQLINLFLMNLGEAYDVFHTTFSQTHHYFGKERVKFDEVALAARNEEKRLQAQQQNVTLFAGRNKQPRRQLKEFKGKKCSHCVKAKRNPNHTEDKCFHEHPELAPTAWKNRWEASAKRQKLEDSEEVNTGMVTFGHDGDFSIKGAGKRPYGAIALIQAREKNLARQVIIDGGCSQHLFASKRVFTSLRPFTGAPTLAAGGNYLQPESCGTASLDCWVNGQRQTVQFPNSLYAPHGGVNLLSETQLLDAGVKVRTEVTHKTLEQNGVQLKARRIGGLFALNLWAPTALAAYSVPPDPELKKWHTRLGHLGAQNIKTLEGMSTGIDLKRKRTDDETCVDCVEGRMISRPHSGQIKPGEYPLEFISTDLNGPIQPTGFNGAKYFVTFRCNKTKLSEVYTLKNKDDTYDAFMRFKSFHERPDRKIRRIRCDGGGEYMAHRRVAQLEKDGIRMLPTTPYSPEQNGAAERFGDMIMRRLSPTLRSADLNKEFWPEIVRTINYLIMRSPNAKLGMTPYQAWHDEIPDLSHLRTIGSTAWRLNAQGKKLKDRSQECILMGFEGNSIYRLWDLQQGRIVRSSDVHVQEKLGVYLNLDGEDIIDSPPRTQRPQAVALGETSTENQHAFAPDVLPMHQQTNSRQLTPSTDRDDESDEAVGAAARPEERRQAAQEISNIREIMQQHPELDTPHQDDRDMSTDPLSLAFSAVALVTHRRAPDFKVPTTHAEAMKDAYHKMDWQLAERDEIQSHLQNKTWIIVQPPKDKQILRGRWVYVEKRGSTGEIIRYKARWVVRGFEQREGIDFTETFASVVKPMSYKVLFALAAANDWELEQMDVKTAFLYGIIQEEVYVEQPHGYREGNGVCKLRKALYGLKQAPRVWHDHFSTFMRELGLVPLHADLCVFIHPQTNTIIALYVDDILLVGPSKDHIAQVKKALDQKFKMTDLGPIHYYLGMTVTRDRPNRTLRLGQEAYVERVVRDHGQWEAAPCYTPMANVVNVQPAPEGYDASKELRQRYQSAVGSLMYAMLGTRPDIAYAVSVVSRYASNPTEAHWRLVVRILRYLRTSCHFQLCYQNTLQDLSGYTDSDFAGDPTRRSTSGYVFNLGSGAISWSSKRQPTVALSTCEAEYLGQTQAAKEAIWLRQLLDEVQPNKSHIPTVIIYGDNQGAIALAKNPLFHARTKHMGIQQAFVRERVTAQEIELEYVDTKHQIADGLTKSLPENAFVAFRKALGLEEPPEHLSKRCSGSQKGTFSR